jgi:hypothetical protein
LLWTVWWTNAAFTVSLYSGVFRRMRSSAPQPARLMIRGCTVAAVATPAWAGSVPGVAAMSGVIRWASTPVDGTAWVPAPALSPAPALAVAPALAAGGSTRTWTSEVPASSHWPSL